MRAKDILIHNRCKFNCQYQGGTAVRIVTFRRATEERTGFLIDQNVYDIQSCASFFGTEALPSSLADILAVEKAVTLTDLFGKVEEARQGNTDLPLKCWAALEEVRLCAPIARPPKIVCLGRNYRDHAEEQGAKIPEAPLLFAKAPTAVIGPDQPIVIPKGSTKVDFEGELALVIGRRTSRADEKQAAEAIFGYTCLNDVTEREAQSREKQWFRAKSMDTFAPLGPCITTSDEVGDPLDLNLTTRVNGEVMQSGTTGDLIFQPVDIVIFASRNITLEPGDIISTGTPGGVGVFRDPQVFLKAGDVVEIEIDKIGTLSNPVVDEI
jgi:2-keto-4-pentenoate hydratase/2-oxohepta-3-ene-1,7-dioic acid hydratase in catechol pathway